MAPADTTAEISFFSDGATYDRKIRRKVGDKERVETVKMRPLQAGDRADIQDAVRITLRDDEGDAGGTELRLGYQKLVTVSKAIVSWTLTIPPSLSTVRALHSDVFDQIYGEVSWGDVPAEPSAEEFSGSPLPASNDS